MESSGEYTVEYKFTADVNGLEQGVKQAKSLVKDATDAVGKDFKVNWGEGSGSIGEYSKWLENAKKETENLTGATSTFSLSQEQMESINKRNAAYMEQYNAQVQSLSTNTVQATDDFSGFDSALYSTTASVGELDLKTQALIASMAALTAAFAKNSLDAFARYEDAVYGMATTVGNVGGTIEQAMEGIKTSTESGLLSEADAAKAINNLTSYGYSVAEATQLIEALTVSSEAHRRSNMTVAEQVVQTTEGIRRQSSMMARASGNSETLSAAQQRYAETLGKTADELDKAEQRQAIFNSYLEAGTSSVAVAEGYENSYAASVQRLNNSLDNLKVAFGQVLAPLATWLANAAAWVVSNKELVAGVVTFVGVIAGGGGLIIAITKLLPLIAQAIAWFSGLHVATKGVILGLATVAATMAVVSVASSSMSNSLAGITEGAAEATDNMDDFTASVGGGGGGGGAVGAVRDLSAELAKLERQYKDELKQIANRHQETIDRLTKQIQDANVDYKRAIDERNAEFATSQAKEEKKHQEKVDDIMEQIRFLQRYNNDYNRQKLANLEFALAKENALYQKQTEAAKNELELQNENDRIAYEEKRQQYQKELDDELAFMNKHRADLQEVQNWILEDEIESLKRRYEEQQASYEQQSAAAGAAGASIGDNFIQNLNKKLADAQSGQLQTDAFNLGSATSKSVIRGAWEHIKSVANDDDENFLARIWRGILGDETFHRLKYGATASGSGWASGGYTGQGGVNEVAGVVHKGEYVLPQEMVDQNTGTPKALGNTYVINVSGTFATSAAERRKVADQIVAAINQNNKSRLEASWQ